MRAVAKEERRVAHRLVLIFVLLAAGIVTVAYRSYRNYERNYYSAAEHQLTVIADLKANELVQYRKERLENAGAFLNNDGFSVLVQRFLKDPEDVDAQWQIQEWAGKLMATDQYDHVRLLDAQGVTRLSSPVGLPQVSFASQRIPEVLRTDQVTFRDFHRNEHDQRAYLNIMVPIFEEQDVHRPLGVFYLRIDPEKYLYPIIQRWPTPSQTAETLIIRRDGNDALYLNDLRYRTNAALNLRVSLEQTNVPAVRAALGQTGIMQGVDYRGVPVIAAVRAVSDAPWFLVAKIDMAEVYAPLRERLRLTILLMSLLLIGAGFGIGVFWRHQRVKFYKKQYKMAEALRENEERLRSHTDNSPMAVVEWGADLIITRWTGAAEKIFGWSAEEAIGKSIMELPGIYDEDLPVIQSVIQKLTDGVSKHVVSSIRNRARNGQIIHCEWYNSVLHDAGGKIISVLSQVLDITERKRTEEALRESQALYYSLVEQLPVGVFRKDTAGRYVLVNPWFCRLKGMKAEEFLGKTALEVAGSEVVKQEPTGLAVEYAAAGGGHHEQIMQTGKPVELVEEYTDVDGRKQFIHALKLPIFDLGAKIIGTQGILSDITELKQAAEKVRASEIRLRTLVQTIPDLVWLKDTNGVFLSCNTAFERLFGVGESAIVGKTDYDFVDKSLADFFRRRDQAAMAADEQTKNEEWLTFVQDGYCGLFQTIKTPVHDANGALVGVLGVARDITGIKRSEEALRESEEKHRVLIETTATGFVIVDAKVCVIDANDEYARLAGYEKREQILGRSVTEWIAAHDQTRSAEEIKKCIASGLLRGLEVDYVHPDGTVLPIEINASTLGKGDSLKIVALCRDITRRKQTEDALHVNQERLLKVVSQTRCILNSGQVEGPADWRGMALKPESPFRWDFPVQNEETAQKILPLELAPGEKYQQAWTRSRNRADHAQMNWNSGNAFLNNLPFYRNEFRCIDKHGIGHWMQQLVTVRKLAENRWEVFGITTDISDLKRIETELRESQALYHSLVNQMPAGIFRKDAKGRYIFVNSAYCRLKEMAPERFLGKTVLELGTTDVVLTAKGASDHTTIMQNGNQIEEDELFSRANGEIRNYHTMKSPVFDSTGKIVGTQGILFDITERKQAEEALRESQALYYSLVEQLPIGVFRKDPAGRYVLVNPEFCRLKGMKAEEFLGKTPQDVADLGAAKQGAMGLTAKYAAAGMEHHEQIMQTGKPIELVEEYAKADGGKQFLHAIKLPVMGPDGKIIGTQGIQFDITELKQATQRVADALNFNQTVLRAAPVGVVVFKASGPCVSANEAIGQIVGGPREEVLKQNFRQLESWKISGMLAAAEDALAAQAERNLETQSVTTFGRKGWFSCRFAPFPYAGEPHLLLTVNDITERKRAEVELHWSETQLHVILESTADGILAVDSKGKTIVANQRFAELWRIPQPVMDARDDRALLDFAMKQLSDPDIFLKKVQSLYNTDAKDMDTLVFKDGRTFERYSFPMIMDGAVIGRVWSFRDITGRKRQEKELNEKNSELERFTYTVSHDLKSPLVTVKTFLGYLEQDLAGTDKERVKQDVAYMHTAADKMGLLLDELLNLARVGRKMNPAERVTFKEIAQEVVRLVAGRISTGGAEVQVADAAVVLEGDRPRLMEIWQNLVENACKFMGNQPKPRVEIGVEKRGSETVFFVRDNGMGIDPRYQAKVFGLFEKLDPKGEGTGMGLALVKRIVEMYKGRIWVESPGLGQGANFLFTLPEAVIIDLEQSS